MSKKDVNDFRSIECYDANQKDEDICPFCGSEELEYYSTDYLDGDVMQRSIECQLCNKLFYQDYSIQYIGITIKHGGER